MEAVELRLEMKGTAVLSGASATILLHGVFLSMRCLPHEDTSVVRHAVVHTSTVEPLNGESLLYVAVLTGIKGFHSLLSEPSCTDFPERRTIPCVGGLFVSFTRLRHLSCSWRVGTRPRTCRWRMVPW